jgi:hypothetical protein
MRSTALAYEWSPDGKHIAYLRLDDGPVPHDFFKQCR